MAKIRCDMFVIWGEAKSILRLPPALRNQGDHDSATEAMYYLRLVKYAGRIQANAGLAEQLRVIEVLAGPHVEESRKRLRSKTAPREETAAEIATSSRGPKDTAADRPPTKRQCAPNCDLGCTSVTAFRSRPHRQQ